MKKLLALTAMAGIMMSAAVAPMPVVAAEVPAHCAILPLLKAECRDALRAAAEDPAATVVVASSVSTAAARTSGAVADAVDSVTGWSCVRTPDGPALFSCSK
jgi:hypothetical protein